MDGDGHLVEIEAGPAMRWWSPASRPPGSIRRCRASRPAVAGPRRRRCPARRPARPEHSFPWLPLLSDGPRSNSRGRPTDLGRRLAPGRYARGEQSERFRFEHLVQDMEVRRDGALVYRDRFPWEGPWDTATAAWHLGHGPATGSTSLFVTGPVDACSTEEPGCPIRRGLTACLGRHRHPFVRPRRGPEQRRRAHRIATRRLCGRTTPRSPTRPLSLNNLGPTHWFSVIGDDT